MPRSDYELIRDCRNGDSKAWREVLDQYERLVYSIPLNYGLSPADAADITQLTFTIFMQSLDELKDDSRLAPWLATVAKRHTWRLLKRKRRESVDPEENLSDKRILHGAVDTHNPMERLAMLEWVNQGLSLLRERCRKLLLALYFDPNEPSYEDVAERFGMAVGSIGPTRARCLKRMKEALEAVS
ncbi:MAG: RNA polymerase sigma factor [Chloroflexota bacterium]|nr:RNA polymerase sigma factor [Chloroflexota bacterium]